MGLMGTNRYSKLSAHVPSAAPIVGAQTQVQPAAPAPAPVPRAGLGGSQAGSTNMSQYLPRYSPGTQVSAMTNPEVQAGGNTNATGVSIGLQGGNAVTDQMNRGPDPAQMEADRRRMAMGAQMGNANPNNAALSGYLMG